MFTIKQKSAIFDIVVARQNNKPSDILADICNYLMLGEYNEFKTEDHMKKEQQLIERLKEDINIILDEIHAENRKKNEYFKDILDIYKSVAGTAHGTVDMPDARATKR